jgi:soluble lytic murein transglycosylase-like protein
MRVMLRDLLPSPRPVCLRPLRLLSARLRRLLALATLGAPALSLLALSLPALAAPPLASPSQLCESAIVTAEHAERLPERMMGAIALVETGRPDPTSGTSRPWPWTINAEGQGFFFASKQQAIEAVRSLQARGVRSIDVGCMQINLMFHPNAFASLDQAFDPEANARFAARFLTALHTEKRDWPAAIAAYHSETPALGAAYRQLVMARWEHPGLTAGIIHYADFSPRSANYRDFLPHSQVYGAFANAFDALPTAPLR